MNIFDESKDIHDEDELNDLVEDIKKHVKSCWEKDIDPDVSIIISDYS